MKENIDKYDAIPCEGNIVDPNSPLLKLNADAKAIMKSKRKAEPFGLPVIPKKTIHNRVFAALREHGKKAMISKLAPATVTTPARENFVVELSASTAPLQPSPFEHPIVARPNKTPPQLLVRPAEQAQINSSGSSAFMDPSLDKTVTTVKPVARIGSNAGQSLLRPMQSVPSSSPKGSTTSNAYTVSSLNRSITSVKPATMTRNKVGQSVLSAGQSTATATAPSSSPMSTGAFVAVTPQDPTQVMELSAIQPPQTEFLTEEHFYNEEEEFSDSDLFNFDDILPF